MIDFVLFAVSGQLATNGWDALIGAAPSVASALIAALAAWLSYRNGKKAEDNILTTVAHVDEIHKSVNGNVEKLVKASGAVEYARGSAEATEVERLKASDLLKNQSATAVAAIADAARAASVVTDAAAMAAAKAVTDAALAAARVLKDAGEQAATASQSGVFLTAEMLARILRENAASIDDRAALHAMIASNQSDVATRLGVPAGVPVVKAPVVVVGPDDEIESTSQHLEGLPP